MLLLPDLRDILVWDSKDFTLFDFGEIWNGTKFQTVVKKKKQMFGVSVTETYLDDDRAGSVL